MSGAAGTPSFRARRKSTTSTSTGGERDQTLRWARQTAATAAAHGFPIRAAQAGTARPFYYLPELHRLRGDLLARRGRGADAAQAYRRALELAAGHGSRSAELRRRYDQFEEGFGTPDLRAAGALLGQG